MGGREGGGGKRRIVKIDEKAKASCLFCSTALLDTSGLYEYIPSELVRLMVPSCPWLLPCDVISIQM